jgi:hypothetical protein
MSRCLITTYSMVCRDGHTPPERQLEHATPQLVPKKDDDYDNSDFAKWNDAFIEDVER